MSDKLFTPRDEAMQKLIAVLEKGRDCGLSRFTENLIKEEDVKAKDRKKLQTPQYEADTKKDEQYEREESKKRRDLEIKQKRRAKEFFETNSELS